MLGILDSLSEISYFSDPFTYKVLYANRSLIKKLGRDPTGNLCFMEFQNREDPCPFCNNHELLAHPEVPIYWEYHNPIFDRDYFIIDKLVRWFDGRVVRFELALDITERKKAEMELKSLYLALPVGVGLVSYPDRRLLRVSRRLCEMLGYREDELLGKEARILYPTEEEYRRVGTIKYRMIQEKGVGSIETRWVCRDGRLIDVMLNSAYLDPRDPSKGTVFTAMDITEIKRAKEYRERANQVIMGLGPNALDNVVSILIGTRDIFECSNAAYLGKEGDRLVYLDTSIGARGFKQLDEVVAEQLLLEKWGKGEIHGPLSYRDLSLAPDALFDPILSSGMYRSCLISPVWWRKSELKGLLYALDKSPREWSAEEVQIMELMCRSLSLELERYRREEDLKDLIDVFAHELRHPTTLLAGYSSTLLSNKGELDDEIECQILEGIEQGAFRLSLLSKRLLDAARLQRGLFYPELEELDLRELAEKAVAELRERGYRNPVNIVLTAENTVVKGDLVMLHELLVNLIENAMNFSPSGSPVEVDIRTREGELLVSVLDRGFGIPDDYREKVFDRLFQVEMAKHHSKPGMGLGLYIAREIVKAHGGRIWNEPREGGGTVFRFTLPLTDSFTLPPS